MQLVGGDHIYNLPVLRGVGSGHFTSVAEKELSFYPCYEAGPFLPVLRSGPFLPVLRSRSFLARVMEPVLFCRVTGRSFLARVTE